MKNKTIEANFFMMLSEMCVVLFIYLVMLYVDLKIILFASMSIGINIFLIKYLVINKIKKWGIEKSKAIEEYSQDFIKNNPDKKYSDFIRKYRR